MSAGPTHPPSDHGNLRGITWMVVSMAAFAVEDALLKRAARDLPVGQLLALFGAGGALVFAALLRRAGQPLLHPDALSPAMRVRAGFELMGRLFYGLAITLTPLSSATAILQATPVLVVLGGSLYFGERVGALRWAAVLAGLAGVLIVLRPTAADFSPLSLLAVLGMAGFAGRDLASRAAPRSLSTGHLGLYGFATVVVAGALYAWWDGRAWALPGPVAGACLASAALLGPFAYSALMLAMRSGDIATVTPFRYSRMFFGIGLGVLLFGERLDGRMLLGCAVILSAGLLIAWHGRRRTIKG